MRRLGRGEERARVNRDVSHDRKQHQPDREDENPPAAKMRFRESEPRRLQQEKENGVPRPEQDRQEQDVVPKRFEHPAVQEQIKRPRPAATEAIQPGRFVQGARREDRKAEWIDMVKQDQSDQPRKPNGENTESTLHGKWEVGSGKWEVKSEKST